MQGEIVLNDLSAFDEKVIEVFVSEIRGEISVMRGGRQLLGLLDFNELYRVSRLPNTDSVFTRAVAIDGVLVGIVWSEMMGNFFGDKICQIEILVVSKRYRGAGAGEALYLDCEKWAKAHGAAGVEVVVLPGDRHTKNFCERNGLIARSLTMFRPLSSES